ncbi:hypothetical protein BOW53_15710 [Solemya pervernicosa gill symbiont]|uniref:Transglutaminase-like domain-containing protein n=2 Tax=Gammaproteobacteria incertae sedis TaxID=118884 RepID=A0A1T2L058_9GAMM|nr:hypothetical protein BOW53_15710 [Solemya pervernicosa gill symbiont]QKQ28113.1 transglutaminase family protein [Candidatus Reidiella endopervernicosa]
MEKYLVSSEIIDFDDIDVANRAKQLAGGTTLEVAQRCFEWVRDEIDHSNDIGAQQLTCNASEVLRKGHGLCYAKSHLLAALLRANAIPTGFGYQRLYDDAGDYMLHGYNMIHIGEQGWYRVDARGNKPGVDAQFMPPREQLAWRGDGPGECDYRINLAEPLPQLVRVLHSGLTVAEAWSFFPKSVPMG